MGQKLLLPVCSNMLDELSCRSLENWCIDCGLTMLHKITYGNIRYPNTNLLKTQRYTCHKYPLAFRKFMYLISSHFILLQIFFGMPSYLTLSSGPIWNPSKKGFVRSIIDHRKLITLFKCLLNLTFSLFGLLPSCFDSILTVQTADNTCKRIRQVKKLGTFLVFIIRHIVSNVCFRLVYE